MELYQGAFLIIAVLGILLLMLAVKTNSHLILNFILRGIGGSLFIFCVNQWAEMAGYSLSVGLNPGTVLTSTILGFPGVFALYGIGFYKIL